MKRPNLAEHMLIWGLFAGILIAPLYMMLINSYAYPPGLVNNLMYLALFALIALPVGIAGIVLALVNVFVIKLILQDFSTPFLKDIIRNKRKFIYPLIFAIPLLIPIVLQLEYQSSFDYLYFGIVPFIIAALVSTYATHRYLKQLLLWSEKQDKRKSKAYHDSLYRLMDSETNTAELIPNGEIVEYDKAQSS